MIFEAGRRGKFPLIGVCFFLTIISTQVTGFSIETDKQVLLDFRNFLRINNTVNKGKYETWNSDSSDPCRWWGIRCSGGRVTRIDLSNSTIRGPVYANFSALTELQHLNLSGNAIGGSVPADLGQCRNLQELDLNANILEGSLNLTGLTKLRFLDVTVNRLTGDIKSIFPAICGSIEVANLSANKFSGDVIGCFDECKKLQYLDLSSNSFSGDLWKGFARLKEFSISENLISGNFSADIFSEGLCVLEVMDLSVNNITGVIPSEVSNCKQIKVLNVWGNNLDGKIPSEIGQLKNLSQLMLGNNSFDPEIPLSLVNCTNLNFLDLSRNNFTGDIQKTLGEFRQIRFLTIHANSYTGGIVSSGILKIPNLTRLDLSYNKFSGEIPVEITTVTSLKFLILAYNSFSGSIPPEIGKLSDLQLLDISSNNLTGSIPSGIGNLASLLWLMFANNSLSGEIPREIGKCKSLLWLNLAKNQLSGQIPSEIFEIGSSPEQIFQYNEENLKLPVATGECLAMKRWIPANYPPFSFVYTLLTRKSCRGIWDSVLKGTADFPICQRINGTIVRQTAVTGYLQISENRLSGEIPTSIGKTRRMSWINFGFNNLTGSLPSEIGVTPVQGFNASHNRLSGVIPDAIGDLVCMNSLDLAGNNFSGNFPANALSRLSELTTLNVSFNPLLKGTIPETGQLGTFDSDSFLGDPLLCVLTVKNSSGCLYPTKRPGIPLAPRIRYPTPVSPGTAEMVARVFPAMVIVLILVGILVMVIYHVRNKQKYRLPDISSTTKRNLQHNHSYASSEYYSNPIQVFRLDQQALFTYADVLTATRNFSESMIVGRGGYGTVYRGRMSDGRDVAVKKLQREGPEAEREFRAEMEILRGGGGGNGWRHPNLATLYGWCLFGSEKLLVYEYVPGGSLEELLAEKRLGDWRRRIEIAKGIAKALSFLHHDCLPAIVHRDVKASNVLLDADGRPRVTDFGLARVVGPGDSHVTTIVAGTVGYVAPEYGQTWHATTRGDVYSYGVLVMELVTGRKAISGAETDGPCLVDWVKSLATGSGFGSSPKLDRAVDPSLSGDGSDRMVELLRIGLRCTAENPQIRPHMKEVLWMLNDIDRVATTTGSMM